MNANEEIIEELNENSDVIIEKDAEINNESLKEQSPGVDQTIINNNEINPMMNNEEIIKNEDEASPTGSLEESSEEQMPSVKKSKAPLIILLSFLLVIDIAALVIYIIGIEKVISFIK